MQILSNGYKLPETGDFGNVWFPALEDNIQRVNDHDHDGSNSERIPSTSVNNSTVAVASGDFADQGDGYWRATVSTPGGVNFDEKMPLTRLDSGGDTVYPRYEKVSSTSMYVYVNTPANMTVHFS